MTGCSGRLANDISADASIFIYYNSDPSDAAPHAGPKGTNPVQGANPVPPADEDWHEDEGTSISAPLTAAYYALVDECPDPADAGGCTPQWDYDHVGQLNDVVRGDDVFTTSGFDTGTCTPAIWCTAGPGYDGPTGNGTISGAAVPGASQVGSPTSSGRWDASANQSCPDDEPTFYGTGCMDQGYVQGLTSTDATLSATIYPNSYATDYWWEYGTTTSYGQSTAELEAGSGTSLQVVAGDLPNLDPNTTYHYRLVTQNVEAGDELATTYGFDFTFTTPGDATPIFGNISTIAGTGGTGETGADGDGGPAIQASVGVPGGVAVDASGNVYVADDSGDTVREINYDSDGITTVAGNGTAGYRGNGVRGTTAELNGPTGLTVGPDGTLYIADALSGTLRAVDPTTGIITTVAGTGKSGYNGDGGSATTEKLNYPEAIAIDSAGNLYIADSGNNRIREVVAATGDMITIAGNGDSGYTGDGGPAGDATLNQPQGIAVDAQGNIYIADYGNNAIREIQVNANCADDIALCNITTIAGDGNPGYNGDGGLADSSELDLPYGVAVDSYGNVYIADGGNNVVREIVAATGDIQTIAGDGAAGWSGDTGPASSAELNGPDAVTLSPGGDLYIADAANYRIREVSQIP